MAKIIAIHSFRGGTGKSNITANLAALVALAGHRVGDHRHRHPIAGHPCDLWFRPGQI